LQVDKFLFHQNKEKQRDFEERRKKASKHQ